MKLLKVIGLTLAAIAGAIRGAISDGAVAIRWGALLVIAPVRGLAPFSVLARQVRLFSMAVFPGLGASSQSLLGIVLIAIGVILGAALVPATITQLVDAAATTGITTSAGSLVDVGQLVGVIALAVAPALAGMFTLFKDVRQ